MNTLVVNQKTKHKHHDLVRRGLSMPAKLALLTGAFLFSNFLFSNIAYSADDPMDLVESVLAEKQPSLDSSKPNITQFTGDFNIVSVYGEEDYNAFLGKSEIWADKWGVSAEFNQNDQISVLGFPKDSSFFNLDIKRRFGSQDKSNIELGVGWQELNIDSQLDASGPKLSLAGQYNLLKGFQVYGSTSYFPELEDQALTDTSLSAYEFEAGLLYKPLPSISVKAGYRVFNLDLEDPLLEDLGSTSGFLLGTDLSW